MRIAKVIGTVTLSKLHPSLEGARFKLVLPQTWENLYGSEKSIGEIVVFDELGAGIDSTIAMSEGREGSMPFYPNVKPVDAYNAAILDTLEYDQEDESPNT